MSLFGSLFTGVSSLAAQSQNTAMISNNIANVSTTGFKRSEAFFDSLVTTESRSSRFSPGTVSVTRVQRVDQQGPIQQTASATDAAISGNGMFPVKRSTDSGQEFLYTRSGSFSEDAQGLLRNTAGYVMFAWPIDSNGNLPAGQGDLSSLVAADVAFLGGLTRPTTTAELAINVDANEPDIQTVNNGGTAVSGIGLPVPNTQQTSFSRGLTVFDSLGSAQTLDLSFRKITGPMANITTQTGVELSPSDNLVDVLTGISDSDEVSITMAGATNPDLVIEFDNDGVTDNDSTTVTNTVSTVQDFITAIRNYDFGTPSGSNLEARIDSSGQIIIQAENVTDSFTFANVAGQGTPVNGGAGSLNLDTAVSVTAAPTAIAANYPANDQSLANPVFPAFANPTTPNTQGWWELKISYPDGSLATQGLLNFDTDGSLNAVPDPEGNIDVELQNLDFNNGSALQDIRIDVNRFSQFAGNFDVIFSDQNGAELGLRTGVELTRDGVIVARFSNGASADLYKVPLVTFANPNGLQEVSGTAYSETEESGEENLREAGSGGAGFVEPSTLETSNVDIADEFAKLIVSQRTFTASTRVINTVDQMTEDLIRLR